MLAPLWNLRAERIEEACLRHRPTLQRDKAPGSGVMVARIGRRARLPCAPHVKEEVDGESGGVSPSFVWTGHALRVMERAVRIYFLFCGGCLVSLFIYTVCARLVVRWNVKSNRACASICIYLHPP